MKYRCFKCGDNKKDYLYMVYVGDEFTGAYFYLCEDCYQKMKRSVYYLGKKTRF